MSEGGDKSRFRWLDVARYVLAFVMTVLIAAVIINAIKVVLRPDSLSLSTGGSISSRRYPPSADPDQECSSLLLELTIRTRNPRDRVHMYYVNITAYLFANMTAARNSDSQHLEDDSFDFFDLQDESVPQLATVNSYKEVDVTITKMEDLEFYTLCKGGSLRGVAMRLEGTLITEVLYGVNASTIPTTYYCGPLLLGGNPDDPAFQNEPDAPCSEVQGNHVGE